MHNFLRTEMKREYLGFISSNGRIC